jgi:hypothetical protein
LVNGWEGSLAASHACSCIGGWEFCRRLDDGIHADTQIEIDDADLEITDSFEGIESAQITIKDGNFIIVSSDDGLNVAGVGKGSPIKGPVKRKNTSPRKK